MSVRAGFDGFYKESDWMPVAVDLENRGQEVIGSLVVTVPNPGDTTTTTYLRPVVLGSQARQRLMLYVHPESLPGEVVVRLRARKGPDAEASATLTQLSAGDTLIVTVAPDRGTLSFLSGARRGLATVRRPGPRGMISRMISGPTQALIRVADVDPDLLPDLAHGYAPVDLVVIGDISARRLRPEAKEALRRWVLSGGTLVITGGPDWARLNDPFFAGLLPVQVTGAADVQGLDALGLAYGAPLSGPAVVSRAAPRPGASVRLKQGGLPLIVDGPVGSGRVVFFAFDAARPPLRGWAGQTALWNECLGRAQGAAPLLHAALEDPGNRYGGGLPGAVLNIPAMQTPPFWGVALFLGGYVVLLVPVNYFVLKWRRRRELAWLTTPAIVVLFAFLAYFIGYSMKGGRLLVNQLSFIETRAGARSAGLTSLAGIFSPAKTSYQMQSDDPEAALSEVHTDPSGRASKDLTISETETMSLSQVPMDMWSMRVFKLESVADLGSGVDARLVLANGRIEGQVTNRAGFALTNCEVRSGGAVQSLGDLANGATARVSLNIGAGQPASIAGVRRPSGYYGYYGGGPRPAPVGGGTAGQMRAAVQDAFFGSGQAPTGGGPLLSGWCDKRFAGLTVQGRAFRPTHLTFVIVHLPLSAARQRAVTIPYGIAERAVIEEQGTDPWRGDYGTPGVRVGSGYIVNEFRLPVEGASLTARRLEVYADFTSYGGTTASLSVYNWQTGAWDALPASRGAVVVPNPAAHLKMPQGLVRVKVQGPRSAPSSYGSLLLTRLDVSLKGDMK